MCKYQMQEECLLDNIVKKATGDDEAPEIDEEKCYQVKLLNSINIQPKPIGVKETNMWK